jgi:hypothetical protein
MRQSDTGGPVLRAGKDRKFTWRNFFLASHDVQVDKKRRTVFDLAPFLELSSYDLFRLRPRARLFDTPYVKRAILTSESTDAAHVVAIVGKLVAREAVLARIWQRTLRVRKGVQVLALPAVGTAPTGEEETAVAYAGRVCARQAGVFFDVASRLGFCLAAEGYKSINQTNTSG